MKNILWMRKSIVPLVLAFFLSTFILALPIPTIAQPNSTTTVYLDPPTINGTVIDETFTVNISISDAQKVKSWQTGMAFNATLLECTSFFQGEFLRRAGEEPFWMEGTINNVAGLIKPPYYCSLIGSYNVSGDGQLAYATFKVKAPGVSDIHLRDVKVWDYLANEVPFNIIDVYTVAEVTPPQTVVTVSNSTGAMGLYGSGFYNHAFSISDKELSFNVTTPRIASFSNVTIPKALLSVDALDEWKVIIDGTPLSTAQRTITENETHTSIYFMYIFGIHKIQIIGKYVARELAVFLDAPTTLFPGDSSLLNATVYNFGLNNETDVQLFLLIDGYVVENVTIPALVINASYKLSYLWNATVGAMYNVTAYSPPKTGETVTDNNVATKFVLVSRLSIDPPAGPVGTRTTVKGSQFLIQTKLLITFNDMLLGYIMTDENGTFTFTFNIPVSSAGMQTVKAYEAVNMSTYGFIGFTVTDATPLDIEIDVGGIHFRGESAEFYMETTFKGKAVNATSINATLYGPNNETTYYRYPENITWIAGGFYNITYAIPVDAQNGTYALAVEADYITNTIESHGTSFKTFLLSSTLAEELALIKELKAEIAALNTTLNNLGQTFTGELALMEEDLEAQIAALNTTLNSLDETITQLETRIDTIKSAQEAFTPPLYAAVVLALIAAVGAIVTILLRRKTTP